MLVFIQVDFSEMMISLKMLIAVHIIFSLMSMTTLAHSPVVRTERLIKSMINITLSQINVDHS